MTDDELRKLWRAAGGAFHGPNIETGTMPESKLLPFLRNLAAPQPDSVPQDSGERAEFEVALVAYFAETQPDRAHKIDVDDMVRWRGTRGDYADRPVVRGMWEGWQRRAALAQKAVAVAGEPVQWQPIGTAPKTGRTLLLGYPNVLGKWRTVRGEWISQACIDNEWEEPENGEPGWYETSVEADDPPNCWPITPTHWMFLPAAPDADAVQPATPKSSPDNGFSGISGSQVATPPAPIASTEEALYTMDQMREYADNFHLSRMRVLVAEKEAYERHAPVADSFQARVQPWMLECFGAEIAADKIERNHRFFEEATETVQANGMTRSEAHQLVDYTYDRPVGELHQEVGGVMVTLAALCLASGIDMHEAGEVELARVWTKIEKIRAKQAAKPKHSPLPEHTHPAAAQPSRAEVLEQAAKICDRFGDARAETSSAEAEVADLCADAIRDLKDAP